MQAFFFFIVIIIIFSYPSFLVKENLSTITQNKKENSVYLNSLLYFLLWAEKLS